MIPLNISSFLPISAYITFIAEETTLGWGLIKHFLSFSAYNGIEFGHSYSTLYKAVRVFYTILGF